MSAKETLASGKGLRIADAAFNFPLITLLLFLCALAVVSSVYTMIPINKVLSEAFQVSEIKAAWASRGCNSDLSRLIVGFHDSFSDH